MPDPYNIDPKIIERYRKVRDRHLRGATDGERAAAGGILTQMRTRYPLIDLAADEADQAESDAKARATSGMAPDDEPQPGAKSRRPGWVDAGLDWLRNAAEEAAARATVPFIATARGSVRVRRHTVTVTVTIPIEELQDAFASTSARALPDAFAAGLSSQVGEIATEAFRVWLYSDRR